MQTSYSIGHRTFVLDADRAREVIEKATVTDERSACSVQAMRDGQECEACQ